MQTRAYWAAVSLGLGLALALGVGPQSARADDEPVGTVIEPGEITSAPTGEDASANAGGGFDTPADQVETDTGGDLQPQPLTVEPNE